jgi:hypothetical protein
MMVIVGARLDSLAIAIVPLWVTTISCTTYKPSPVPSGLVV